MEWLLYVFFSSVFQHDSWDSFLVFLFSADNKLDFSRSCNMSRLFINVYNIAADQIIHTSSSKPLLACRLWGLCRHPNYFGCLLMAIAWSLPCGKNFMPPFITVVMISLPSHRSRLQTHKSVFFMRKLMANEQDEIDCCASSLWM